MTGKDVARLRLISQGIAQTSLETPESVVHHLLAMQAQDYPGALWAVGLRMRKPDVAAIEQAITDRKIVRTWPMRGTLHFMHAADARWLVELLAPRVTTSAKGRRLNLGLTDTVMAEAEAILRTELSSGKVVRRDSLRRALATGVRGVAIEAPQFGHILRNFGERGIICFGPHDGKQPTFVLLDDWLPKTPARDRDEALGELARRYFTSHGPATLRDFAGWGYLTMGDARTALELARAELETIVVSDTVYYIGRVLEPVDTPRVCLLPGFDEYMLGYKDRSAALATAHSQKIIPGNNGMFLPTVILDGRVVGTWKRTVRKSGVGITLALFDPSIDLPQADLQSAVSRYGTFLGMAASVAS